MPVFQLEKKAPFSKSLIWQLQREYFDAAGIEAWRSGEVPHYVTNNPVVGKTYAELALAFLRDLSIKGQTSETVYLIELGAGHGRLCYHFFKHLEKYYEESSIQLPPFCYVLSDFTEANLDFWKDHPRLQPYLAKGWLDFALFDAEKDDKLHLRSKDIFIQTGDLSQPLMIIANYFFDTIPQALFKIEHGEIEQGFLSLISDLDPGTATKSELIRSLKLEYEYEKTEQPIYAGEPVLSTLLENYLSKIKSTHLLFPDTGLRCLERLRKLSVQGLVVLTADKGKHHLSALENSPAPGLSRHGCFSLNVNYHAFREYTFIQGGTALFPLHEHSNIDLGCMLLLNDSKTFRETIHAYERFVDNYGPDDYFSLKKLIEKHIDTLNYKDMMGVIRLSGYDARIFLQMKPRLFELIPTLSSINHLNILVATTKIWDTFYPLGETDNDLAESLGDILLGMTFYEEAINYYGKSMIIYGREPDLLYKIALCNCLKGSYKAAIPFIDELKVHNPENDLLTKLIKTFETELIEK